MEVLDPKAAPEVLEFAKELTRERSKEQLGFDLVEMCRILSSGAPITRESFPEDMARAMSEMGLDPLELEDIGGIGSFLSFGIKGSTVWWNQFSKIRKDLGTMEIMKEIVKRFPETPFAIGDGYYKEYVKGDFCEQLINITLDVGVDNPEAYAKLSAVLKEQQYPPFFLFPLGDLLISQTESALEEAVARLSALVPGEKLYCVLVENGWIEGDVFTKKGIATDSHISWLDMTEMELRALDHTSSTAACYVNKPDEVMFRCFFDEAYLNEVAEEIAREDAKWEAEQKAELEAVWEAKRRRGEDDDLPF
jgi:hypothetical protein